jgi:hypothetical protein
MQACVRDCDFASKDTGTQAHGVSHHKHSSHNGRHKGCHVDARLSPVHCHQLLVVVEERLTPVPGVQAPPPRADTCHGSPQHAGTRRLSDRTLHLTTMTCNAKSCPRTHRRCAAASTTSTLLPHRYDIRARRASPALLAAASSTPPNSNLAASQAVSGSGCRRAHPLQTGHRTPHPLACCSVVSAASAAITVRYTCFTLSARLPAPRAATWAAELAASVLQLKMKPETS